MNAYKMLNSYDDIIKMNTESFLNYILSICLIDEKTPQEIESMEDVRILTSQLIHYSETHMILSALFSKIRAAKRKAKRTEDNLVYEDLVDKEAIVGKLLKSTELSHFTQSRMITSYQIQLDDNKYSGYRMEADDND